MKRASILAADLFCGAGGTSTGLLMACNDLKLSLDLLAVNHWNVAIETHKANHPYARHLCESADNVDPRKVIPSGRLKIFVASPECTHHSNARGGRPMNDQSRASAWHVLRWAEALYIDNIIIENVKEFRSWGPLGANGRPVKRLKGQLYLQFLASLRALGYNVEDRVLNCADYGDPTTRERLFIIARRGKKIAWPEPSHCDPAKLEARNGNGNLFKSRPGGEVKPWVAAREIIDWQLPSQSIFNRKKPLAAKTLQRIYAGFQKFNSAEAAEPYLIVLRQHMGARSLDSPLPTLCAGGQHVGLCEPFVLSHPRPKEKAGDSVNRPLRTITATSCDMAIVEPVLLDIDHTGGNGDNVRPVSRPVSTQTTKARTALVESTCEPVIVNMKGKSNARSVDSPTPTQTTKNHLYVAEPDGFILPHRMLDQGAPDSLDRPLRTLVGKNGRQVRVCQPVLIPFFGERDGQAPRAHSVDEPLPTVTGHGAGAVAEAFIIDLNHGIKPSEHPQTEAVRRVQSVDRPLPTVTTNRGKGLVEAEANPYLVKYNSTGSAYSVEEPIQTISTKDRYALVTTARGTFAIDIRLRMLKTHELAAAHSVRGYILKGKSEEQVKQIGNMVPAQTARALCRSVLV